MTRLPPCADCGWFARNRDGSCAWSCAHYTDCKGSWHIGGIKGTGEHFRYDPGKRLRWEAWLDGQPKDAGKAGSRAAF